jgi:hypothetical protein
VEHGLKTIACALEQWRNLAQKNGLMESEIKRYASAFEHGEIERLKALSMRPMKGGHKKI